jgi:helix-turn-helix protein/uncharacterized protein DUF4115
VSSLSAPDLNHDNLDDDVDEPTDPEQYGPAAVEIRRNRALSGGIGVVAALVCVAYLTRMLVGGSWFDWVLALGMGAVAAAYLSAYADGRTPLLVADAQGIRIRLGRSWRGVPWEAIECVEHRPRRGLLQDGKVVLVVHDPELLLAELDASDRRQVAITRRLHGSPFAIPLSLATRVVGADGDLTLALEELSGDPDQVFEVDHSAVDETDDDAGTDPGTDAGTWTDDEDLIDDETTAETAGWTGEEAWTEDDWEGEQPTHPVLPDPRPMLARGLDFLADRLRLHRPDDEQYDDQYDDRDQDDDTDQDDDQPEFDPPAAAPTPTPTVSTPIVASATPLPLRDPVAGARVEARFEGAAALKLDLADSDMDATSDLPELGQLRRGDELDGFEETVVWSAGVRPIARAGDPVEPLVIDDLAVEPAEDPVIGPELVAARTRLALTVDQLADRTRIRPHVIESIEVDDFVPCGGDFYARGHLRTLARVLGVDAAPLLTAYDERYADAPIDARRVFEADLATGADGPIRSMRGGPNWSVLIAAVMAVVLIWSIARLVMDSPVDLTSKPVLNGSPSSQTKLGPAVPVLLDAAAGGAHVVVRDGSGAAVFNGDLAFGEKQTVKASPPVRVQSSDGALQVTVDGQKRGPLGAAGQPAQNTFAADD